jgi:glyoxylase-like metal-dependent hydrolase (beta-lactamase superfamily II)
MKSLTRIFTIITFFSIGAAADNHRIEDAEITATHVAGPVHMLMGRGGNIAVSVGDDGVLIVDDEYAVLTGKVQAALKEVSEKPVIFVLNTHHHGDHTGGNAAFGAKAHIIAHENVRKRLSRPKKHDPNSLPIVTYENSASVHFNGEEIKLIHFPNGHTDSDSVIFFKKSNVVHMGDLLFTTSFPSFYPFEGGNIIGYVKNVGEIVDMLDDDTKIIAGHGRLATKADLNAFYEMMAGTVHYVKDQLDDGATLDEVKQKGLPEKYHKWSSTYTSVEQWVAKVYGDLKPKRKK